MSTIPEAGEALECDSVPDDDGAKDLDLDGVTDVFDCDDQDPSIRPGALDPCDDIDNDCNGEIDEDDADCDGVLKANDCDDSNRAATTMPTAMAQLRAMTVTIPTRTAPSSRRTTLRWCADCGGLR